MCSKIRDFFKKCIAFSQKVQYNNTCVEKMHGFLAQLAEHLTLNQGVQGSNPWWRITKYRFYSRWLWGWCFFLFNLYCVISNIKLPIRNRAAIILKTRSKLRRLCFFVNKLYTTCNQREAMSLQIGFPFEENFSSYSVIIFPSFKTES